MTNRRFPPRWRRADHRWIATGRLVDATSIDLTGRRRPAAPARRPVATVYRRSII
jgi:hypothetical protein